MLNQTEYIEGVHCGDSDCYACGTQRYHCDELEKLDEAYKNNSDTKEIINQIDNFETHVVPIIADIDAGFGNEEATDLLA